MVKIKNLNLEVYGIIYKITNKINGKCYIGQTTKKCGFNGRYGYYGDGIERVYKYCIKHKKYSRYYNKHLLDSIKKYGFEAFEVDECFNIAFSQAELDIKEMTYVQLYDSFYNGYNETLGGGGTVGYSQSQETRQKISKANSGRIFSDESRAIRSKISKERWQDEEFRKHMSEIRSGEKHPMYGKHHSLEAKQKQSEARLGKYTGSNSPNAKAVYCFELDEIRLCSKNWANELGLNNTKISEVCNGIREHTGGFHFRFATQEEVDNYDPENNTIIPIDYKIFINIKSKYVPVYCYELDGIHIQGKQWEKELDLCRGSVTRCCKGKPMQYNTKGYHFRYATDEEILEYIKQNIDLLLAS